jgi:hypothetical protein
MHKRRKPFAVGDLVLEAREGITDGGNHFLVLKVVNLKDVIKYKVYWIEAEEELGPISLEEVTGWTYAVVSTTSNNE